LAFLEFEKKYKINDHMINWSEIATKYAAIEISPFRRDQVGKALWYNWEAAWWSLQSHFLKN